MTRYPDLYVLRHGETEWNREGIFQGVHDSPLTAMGREQAAHQGTILDRVISDWSVVDIYSSPQGRAKTTAEIALAGVNRTADLHEALREVDTGDWAGLHISDIMNADPRVFKTRLLEFLESLQKPTVIVTHGMVGFVLRGLYLGLTFEEMAGQVGGQGVVFHLSDGRETVLKD